MLVALPVTFRVSFLVKHYFGHLREAFMTGSICFKWPERAQKTAKIWFKIFEVFPRTNGLSSWSLSLIILYRWQYILLLIWESDQMFRWRKHLGLGEKTRVCAHLCRPSRSVCFNKLYERTQFVIYRKEEPNLLLEAGWANFCYSSQLVAPESTHADLFTS